MIIYYIIFVKNILWEMIIRSHYISWHNYIKHYYIIKLLSIFYLMALQIFDLEWSPYNEKIDLPKFDSGKTKHLFDMQDGTYGLTHNWVLTAYDNPEFTWLAPEKWIASAYSTAVLFKRLEAAWVRTSHRWIINANTTRETALDMLPFEIIWRRYNVPKNSWNKRNKGNKYEEGERYDDIIYEACLKWSVFTDSWEKVDDPFLILDEDFKPLLNKEGLPRLTHSKTGEEIAYSRVIHPNKLWDKSLDEVREAIELFTEKSSEIKEMFQKVQEVTFDTYAQTGRLNADGKWEVWLDKNWNLTLWDEIELDSLRNMSIQEVELDGWSIYQFDKDLLGESLEDIIGVAPEIISRIIKAGHSGKQYYRNIVNLMTGKPFDEERKAFNNAAAQETTEKVYTPVAMALSDRFWKEVWFILSN